MLNGTLILSVIYYFNIESTKTKVKFIVSTERSKRLRNGGVRESRPDQSNMHLQLTQRKCSEKFIINNKNGINANV